MKKVVIGFLVMMLNAGFAMASDETRESTAASSLCGLYGYGCSHRKDISSEINSEAAAEKLVDADERSEIKQD